MHVSYSIPIQIDENPLWSIPPLSMHVSCLTPIHNYEYLLWSTHQLPMHVSYLIPVLMKLPLWSIHPLPMHVSYSIPMQNWWKHLWSTPPFPMFVSCSILIQNGWISSLKHPSASNWNASLKHPSASNACFLFDSYSNLMEILSEASLLFQCMSVIQFLFKIDETPVWSIPPLPMRVSYSTPTQNWWKSSLKHPSASLLFQCMLLFEFTLKMDKKVLWSIPPFPTHVSYWIHTQDRRKGSLKHPSSSNACFLFNFHSKSMSILSEAFLLFQCTPTSDHPCILIAYW